MIESQEQYAARLRKMSLPKFVIAYYEAMAYRLKGQAEWQYEICLAEDRRRGEKAHAKALAKLNETFGIKREGNAIDLRESRL